MGCARWGLAVVREFRWRREARGRRFSFRAPRGEKRNRKRPFPGRSESGPKVEGTARKPAGGPAGERVKGPRRREESARRGRREGRDPTDSDPVMRTGRRLPGPKGGERRAAGGSPREGSGSDGRCGRWASFPAKSPNGGDPRADGRRRSAGRPSGESRTEASGEMADSGRLERLPKSGSDGCGSICSGDGRQQNGTEDERTAEDPGGNSAARVRSARGSAFWNSGEREESPCHQSERMITGLIPFPSIKNLREKSRERVTLILIQR